MGAGTSPAAVAAVPAAATAARATPSAPGYDYPGYHLASVSSLLKSNDKFLATGLTATAAVTPAAAAAASSYKASTKGEETFPTTADTSKP